MYNAFLRTVLLLLLLYNKCSKEGRGGWRVVDRTHLIDLPQVDLFEARR